VTGGDYAGGPLDVATLTVLGQRAQSHPLVETWTLQPDSVSPRWLELPLDDGQYPTVVDSVRLDVRWFEGGEYTFHYLETRPDDRYQCRWDRHPKPDAPTPHFHPPPDAASNPESTDIDDTHHLGVLFAVLEWVEHRLERLHE